MRDAIAMWRNTKMVVLVALAATCIYLRIGGYGALLPRL